MYMHTCTRTHSQIQFLGILNITFIRILYEFLSLGDLPSRKYDNQAYLGFLETEDVYNLVFLNIVGRGEGGRSLGQVGTAHPIAVPHPPKMRDCGHRMFSNTLLALVWELGPGSHWALPNGTSAPGRPILLPSLPPTQHPPWSPTCLASGPDVSLLCA